MKIRCDRNELSERLQGVGGIVSSAPSTKPILKDFLLSADGETDELVVEATDLDIAARVRVSRVEVEEPGRMALDASRLLSLVREIPADAVNLEAVEDGAHLRAEGYEFHLLGDDPDEFPRLESFASEQAIILPREKFGETLRRVSIAASRDLGRFQLTGVYFEIEGEKLVLTATDGKRLANDVLRVDNPEGATVAAIVPNRAIDVLQRVLSTGDETVRLAFRETEAQVAFGYGELMAKLVEGTYPDYHTAMPKEKRTKVIAKRSDLLSAVRSASLVSDRETATVLFRFGEGSVQLESQASDIGQSRIEVPIALEGEPVEIRFNAVFFIDALRTVTEDQIRMEFSGPDRPGTIRGGIHYRHMLMPLVVG